MSWPRFLDVEWRPGAAQQIFEKGRDAERDDQQVRCQLYQTSATTITAPARGFRFTQFQIRFYIVELSATTSNRCLKYCMGILHVDTMDLIDPNWSLHSASDSERPVILHNTIYPPCETLRDLAFERKPNEQMPVLGR